MMRKQINKLVCDSVKKICERTDPRPYATIFINGNPYDGLLDSGASVSLLGRGCREMMDNIDIEVESFQTNVRTASGQPHRILGKVVLNIGYKDVVKPITFYLCPELDQPIYLGVDFWKAFQLAPEIFEVNEIEETFLARPMRTWSAIK